MALTMQHAGMTQLLAEALSAGTGALFPLISPFIGALGAFMTGSNTNSNVVFGQLQQQTAVALNLSVPWILAAQTAGGAIGGTSLDDDGQGSGRIAIQVEITVKAGDIQVDFSLTPALTWPRRRKA